MSAENSQSVDGPTVGERIRRARLSQQLSVRKLAELSGCSASSISQIERNGMNPRVATLLRLVAPLGMTIGQLMSDDDLLHAPLRLEERKRITADKLHHEFPLTRRAISHFEVYIIVLQPGGESSVYPETHGNAQEFILIQKGTGHLTLDHNVHELHVGDTMEHLSSVPHRMVNNGDEPLEYLWVGSPPNTMDKHAG